MDGRGNQQRKSAEKISQVTTAEFIRFQNGCQKQMKERVLQRSWLVAAETCRVNVPLTSTNNLCCSAGSGPAVKMKGLLTGSSQPGGLMETDERCQEQTSPCFTFMLYRGVTAIKTP